jgi:hypothetical protein
MTTLSRALQALPIPSTLAALLCLAALPAMPQAADCTYTTDDGSITITRYTGTNDTVDIPGTLDGLPVTAIGYAAFYACSNLTSITIPGSITSIEPFAFEDCTGLTRVTIPESVTNLGEAAFYGCQRLGRVTIPGSIASIGDYGFARCLSLTNVTLGDGVTTLGNMAFFFCYSLTNLIIPKSVIAIANGTFSWCSLRSVCFLGNAPVLSGSEEPPSALLTVYHLPGTIGWGDSFVGSPTALWQLPYPVILALPPSFGIRTNRFGFIISWAAHAPVVVETTTHLTSAGWSPLATNTPTDGWFCFTDPQWSNSLARFYRLRAP